MSKTQRSKRSFWSRAATYYIPCSILLLAAVVAYLVFPRVNYLIAYGALLLLFILNIAIFLWSRSEAFEGIGPREGLQFKFLKRNEEQTITEPLSSITTEEIQSGAKKSTNIFYVNTPFPDLKEFYGRKFEYVMLIDRIKDGACSSIVGEPKSGKTWLANYTLLRARLELPDKKVKMGYIDASGPECATISGFTREVLEVLGLSYSLPNPNYNLAFLDKSISKMRYTGQSPVLFIDNFEAFTVNAEFDDRFFESLRAMAQVGLALVVMSREPLVKLVSRSKKRSSFFNIFLQISLRPFDQLEAEDFVRSKAAQAGFMEREQEEMLQHGRDRRGNWPPLRLQLVGNMLLEQRNRDSGSDYTVPRHLKDFEKQVEKEYSVLSAG